MPWRSTPRRRYSKRGECGPARAEAETIPSRTEGDEALRRGNHLILDLTHATFVDSSAIAALFAVAKHATASRRVAVLQLGTAEIVETALRLSEIERVLPRASKRSDAIRVIRQLEAGEPRA